MRLTVPDFNKKNAWKVYRKAINYGTAYVGQRLNMDEYRFTPPLPLTPNDRVSTREEKSRRGMCLQEMALMMACWNEHDYSETVCSKEIQAFENCWKNAAQQDALYDDQARQGVTASGRLTAAQANKLLRMYPRPAKT